MAGKLGIYPLEVAKRIYLNAGGSGNREVDEYSTRRDRGGKGGGMSLFAGRMTADWTAGVAECEIYTLDGMTLTYLANADVYDPLYIWAALGDGDYLLVVKQAGKYYIIAAGCPGTSPLIADPPDTLP